MNTFKIGLLLESKWTIPAGPWKVTWLIACANARPSSVWPFSFWAAAQGGSVVFVLLLVVYARRMARNDGRLANEAGQGGDAASAER